MPFFTSGFFWFLQGILFCLVLIGLKVWTDERQVAMPLWKWLVVTTWLVMLGFTIAFVGTSLGEAEPTAAFYGGILFGLIVVISGVGFWRILGFPKPFGASE